MEELFILLLRLFGVLGLLYSLVALMGSIFANSWPKVSGKILSAEIEEEASSDGDYTYKLIAEYQYVVKGTLYRSTRIAYGMWNLNVFWIVSGAYAEITKNHPNVNVKYNPRKPSNSVLLAGVKRFHIANIVFFLVWNWFFLFSIGR